MSYKFNPFTGNFDDAGNPVTTVDTKANILALAPTAPQTAYATDTGEFFIYDGTTWRVASLELSAENQAPDMGYTQGSDKLGYSATTITDKALYNIQLQGNASPANGSIRIDTSQTPNRFQVYLRSAWKTIYEDLTTAYGDFRHSPLDREIYIWRGDSVAVGLNGRSITQEYQVSMGAFPPPKVISGGTF